MSSVVRPTVTLCTLALLALGVMSGTLARPFEDDTSPLLDITTNIKLGGPILGENIGPFESGKSLTITCSTKSPGSVSLSWYQDGKKLEEAVESTGRTILTLRVLRIEDSGRRFTCQDSVSSTNISVKLQVVERKADVESLEILRGEQNLHDEKIVEMLPGENLTLTCIVQGYNPSPVSWWEGEEKLLAHNYSSPYASSSQLLLLAVHISDSGRNLSCRALGGQLARTVVLDVKEGLPDTSKSTTRTISTSSSATSIRRNISLMSEEVPDEDVTSPKVSLVKTIVTTGETESVATSTPVGQGIPVSEAASDVNSGATKATEKHHEKNEMKKYLIVGGAAITFIGLVVIILIFVILKLCKTINKLDTSSSQQHGNSCEQRALAGSSILNTLESLDPLDLPPLSPLLPRPLPVEGGDEMASSGGRMSAVMPEDRDHSYYYPDLINNSYYYPKITEEVKEKILFSNPGQ